jgi:hypothetical protein
VSVLSNYGCVAHDVSPLRIHRKEGWLRWCRRPSFSWTSSRYPWSAEGHQVVGQCARAILRTHIAAHFVGRSIVAHTSASLRNARAVFAVSHTPLPFGSGVEGRKARPARLAAAVTASLAYCAFAAITWAIPSGAAPDLGLRPYGALFQRAGPRYHVPSEALVCQP